MPLIFKITNDMGNTDWHETTTVLSQWEKTLHMQRLLTRAKPIPFASYFRLYNSTNIVAIPFGLTPCLLTRFEVACEVTHHGSTRVVTYHWIMMTSSYGNIFRYWPFLRGFPSQRPVTRSFAWTNVWANNREAGDLRCHRAHYDLTVMHRWKYST